MPKFTDISESRRHFLKLGSLALGSFLLGPLAKAGPAQPGASSLYDRLDLLGPLMPPDANGISVPAGFSTRLIAQSGQPVLPNNNYIWHHAPDGGATFATADGGWIYVSNSEIKNQGGGAGALRFNRQGQITDAYPILRGTNKNCAGGKTPWNTWLSCEETATGLVYECDPFGQRPAIVRPALGRFKHEAVAVDPSRGQLYLTEDVADGGFYRFTPDRGLPDLSSGTLEIAEVINTAATAKITWHKVPDPTAAHTETRYQVQNASRFNGGEGLAWTEGIVYFTTKGDNRVWRHHIQDGHIDTLYDLSTSNTPVLSGVDNIVITASGDLLVAEDGGDMQIVLLSPAGKVIPVLQVNGQDESEICGPAFSPNFDRLYFSSQRGPLGKNADGRIYEVSYTGTDSRASA